MALQANAATIYENITGFTIASGASASPGGYTVNITNLSLGTTNWPTSI
jgi:hypothetical protein